VLGCWPLLQQLCVGSLFERVAGSSLKSASAGSSLKEQTLTTRAAKVVSQPTPALSLSASFRAQGLSREPHCRRKTSQQGSLLNARCFCCSNAFVAASACSSRARKPDFAPDAVSSCVHAQVRFSRFSWTHCLRSLIRPGTIASFLHRC